MKKRSIILILTFILLTTSYSAVFAGSDRELLLIVDNADLLSDYEEELLDMQLESISEKHRCEIIIVTVNSLDGKTATEYADDFFDYNGYGYGENDDGILLLISMEYRDWAISTHGFAITAFPDAVIDYMADEIVSSLSEGNFKRAFSRFSILCDEFLTEARASKTGSSSYDSRKTLGMTPRILISLGIGIVIAFIITSIMKAQLKSVRFQPAADSYIRKNSLNIRQSRNLYLYSSITKRAKPKNTSSSGSHSSRSSTHRSSSGRTHGGRSGKF